MKNDAIRLLQLVFGLFLFALGLVCNMRANLGYSPWDVFHSGLSQVIHLSIGKVSIVISLVVGAIAVLMKEKIGLGSILNMILIGSFMDMLLSLPFFPQAHGILSGLLLLITGLFIVALGSYFYILSGFGAGPRDSLMVAIQRKTGKPVGLCRAVLELCVTLMGWLLGGTLGVGTVIAAFGVSFCIQLVFSLLRFDATSVQHETLDITWKRWSGFFRPEKIQ